MVRTRRFHCLGPGSIPGLGTKILQACTAWPKKKEVWVFFCLDLFNWEKVLCSGLNTVCRFVSF